jgi:hypothetical protein
MKNLNQSKEDASTLIRKRKSTPFQDETPQASSKNGAISSANPRPIHHVLPVSARSSHDSQSQSFSVTIAPPNDGTTDHSKGLINGDLGSSHPQSPSKSAAQGQGDSMASLECSQPSQHGVGGSLLSPSSAAGASSAVSRRKSYDDGIRPLNILFGKKGDAKENSLDPYSLGVPNGATSRSEKRRSINPGLALDYKNLSRPLTAPGRSSPDQMIRSQTLPVNRCESPLSPSKPYFSDASSTRRTSNTSLLRDNASGSTIYHSPPPSPAPEFGRATSDSRMRSTSHDSHHPQSAPPYTRPMTPLRPTMIPPRSDSLNNGNHSVSLNAQRGDGRLSPGSPNEMTLHLDNIPPGSMPDRAGAVTPTSPSHRADVPHGIESGTDTEAEGDNGHRSKDDNTAPAPPVPPKEYSAKARANGLKLDIDPDVSALSHMDFNSDESSPVERTSISTFIAPATLPPIRFSMTGSDFSDFLKSVGGMQSLKSLDQIPQGDEPREDESSSGVTSVGGSSGNSPNSGGAVGVNNINGTVPPTSRQLDPSNSSQFLRELDAEAKDQLSSLSRDFSRSSGDSHHPSPYGHGSSRRERLDSNASLNIISSNARIVVTSPSSSTSMPVSGDSYDLVIRRLHELLDDASERGSDQLSLVEKNFVETIIISMEQRRTEYAALKHKYDSTKVIITCFEATFFKRLFRGRVTSILRVLLLPRRSMTVN